MNEGFPGVIIIGGGPAGLMAAGQAAEMGAEALLLEKMGRPGRKLLLTGKGRCNLTNIATLDEFIQHFGMKGRFLRYAFHRFFNSDLLEFLEMRGIATTVERGGRVFPTSSEASQVVDKLIDWVKRAGVVIETHSKVEQVLTEGDRVIGVQVSRPYHHRQNRTQNRVGHKHTFSANAVILATGGASYPSTGSTGDGYPMVESLGHTIVPIRPALVPLETHGNVAATLQGLSLRNVKVAIFSGDKKLGEGFGEMLFTHFGISGPVILTLSKLAVDSLRQGREVSVSIDLKPALDDPKLDARLLRDFDTYGKRQYRSVLRELLPRKLVDVCIQATGVPHKKPANQITAEERKRLREWLKDFHLKIVGHRPLSQAIITAGGIDTSQVDPQTMESRLIHGLYFAGEALDIDADTGGYNLQAAFSTGWLAGRSAAHRILKTSTPGSLD